MMKKIPDHRKFVFDRNLFVKKGNGKGVATHLILMGGMYKIPPQFANQFLKLYVSDLNNGHYMYISENRTPVFRFFMDLDVMDPITDSVDGKVTEINEIVDWAKIIQGVINEFFPTANTTCYITSGETKTIEKNRKKYLKTGVHLHFPELYLKSDKALVLRQVSINRLIGRYGQRKPDWGEVIDKCVYISSGLRMLGSRKADPCKDCRGQSYKNGITCETCSNTGKIDRGSVYSLKRIINQDGEEDNIEFHKCMGDMFHMISKCSIRETRYDELPFTKPDWYNMPSEEELFDTRKRVVNKKTGAVTTTKKPTKNSSVGKNTKAYKDTMKFFNNVMGSHYSSDEITDMFPYNDGDQYIISSMSNYCMNIAGNHRSNQVYFVIDKNYIYQKCHCKCDTTEGRNFGRCSDYRSKGRALPTALQNVLFPQYKNSMRQLTSVPMSGMTKSKYVEASNDYMKYLEAIINDQGEYEANLE